MTNATLFVQDDKLPNVLQNDELYSLINEAQNGSKKQEIKY